VTKPDDPHLLRDLRVRAPEACAELVRGHYQTVYRFLVHLTRDVHQAEDLTQETFATAWEKITAFEGRSTLATWLHRIAYTKWVDSRRAQQRAAGMLERIAISSVSPGDPLEPVMAGDEAEQLYRMLQGLESRERTLLVLHYLQGLSYAEMASVLDEPAGTVKWRTALALDQLRAMLTEEVPDHATRKTSEPPAIS
jgi:RNA polymerase sigma-70 factor (ECF subfamily)